MRLFILIAAIFSLLFSLGSATPLREWTYRFLPGMDTFRHPATMRIFTSMGMIMLAGMFINEIYDNQNWQNSIRKAALILMGFMAALCVWFGIKMQWPDWNATDLKALLNSISFEWLAFIQGIIQCCFLLLFVAEYATETGVDERGYKHFYSKEIRIHDHITTPTVNSRYEQFLNNPEIRSLFNSYPWIYLSDSIDTIRYKSTEQILLRGNPEIASSNDSIKAQITIKDFAPNRFRLIAKNTEDRKLAVFQQYNHNWRAFVNGNEIPVNRANLAFMSIDLPAGSNEVEFRYQPFTVILSIYFSLAAILVLLIAGVFSLIKTWTTHA
jgi:hypothetical protein